MRHCKCGNLSRPKSAYCYTCHAAYMRSWRKTHPPSEKARKRGNCRRYTNILIKRGKLIPEPCVFCGTIPVEPHHTDYDDPYAVVWVCHEHHLALHHKQAHKLKIPIDTANAQI